MSFYRQGHIQPIRPTRCFDATQVEDAFRSLQKGQHIGKLVVRIPQDHSLLTTTKIRGSFSLRPDASYLLVGGLGGLGRSVSIWLAEHGARNLIFLSRSGGSNSPETAALVEELATVGCSAQIVVGSVACLDDVRQVTTQARLPVAGVLQMSMVLRVSAKPLLKALSRCHHLTISVLRRTPPFPRWRTKTGKRPRRRRSKAPGTCTRSSQPTVSTSSSSSAPFQA